MAKSQSPFASFLGKEFLNITQAINLALETPNLEEILKSNELNEFTLHGEHNLNGLFNKLIELEALQFDEYTPDRIKTMDVESLKEAIGKVTSTLDPKLLNSKNFLTLVAVNLLDTKAKDQYEQNRELDKLEEKREQEFEEKNKHRIDPEAFKKTIASAITERNKGENTYIDLAKGPFLISEAQGQRRNQEDQFFAEEKENIQLNSLQSLEYLAQLNKTIYEKTKSEASGTTSVIGYYNPSTQTFSYSNLGDPRITQVVLNKDGTIDEENSRRLTFDQAPSEPVIYKKIRSKRGVVCMGRINGALATGGAFGNATLEGKVPYEPDFGQKNYTQLLAEGKKIIIITGCDGLYEKDCINERKIKNIIYDYYTNNKNNEYSLSDLLLRAAIGSSDDNITVNVFNINQAQKPVLFGIFDGHGGEECAIKAKATALEFIGLNLEPKKSEVNNESVSINKKEKIDIEIVKSIFKPNANLQSKNSKQSSPQGNNQELSTNNTPLPQSNSRNTYYSKVKSWVSSFNPLTVVSDISPAEPSSNRSTRSISPFKISPLSKRTEVEQKEVKSSEKQNSGNSLGKK
ncbi:MAG: SpoIIE family protein phosphatase [Sphingobacteriia bacterium]|nr:SpoIIE family protein phosphatase [Sphingobacteriia bacterium]